MISTEANPVTNGVKTRAKLPPSKHASPKLNVIPRHQTVPVRIPG